MIACLSTHVSSPPNPLLFKDEAGFPNSLRLLAGHLQLLIR